MKLKGINPIERHIEKIVLVVVAVIFLAVLAMQFLLEPNQVTVGRAQGLPPQMAFRPVEDEARRLEAQMRQTPDLPEIALPDPAKQFVDALEAPVVPRERLIALGRPTPVETVAVPTGLGEGAKLAAIEVPAPTAPVAASYMATLDPAEVVANPDLRAIVPEEQPFDVPFVSVEARFDGTALANRLLEDPDGEEGPVVPLPPNWWRGGLEILAVRLEREERAPSGEWTNLTTVPPLPGRPDLLKPEEAGTADEGLQRAAMLVAEAKRNAAAIQRPPFYRIIAGPAWAPPSEAVAQAQAADVPADVQRLLRQREDLLRQRARLEEELQDDRRPGARRPEPTGKGGIGGVQDPGDDRRRAQLERALQNMDQRIARVDEQLRALGHDPTAPEAERTAPRSAAASEPATPWPETPDLRLWAHDLTAKPGATYRYRVQLVINNPVFGRASSLSPDQQSLAAEPVLLSAPSEWTEPVRVLDDSYFFVTSAAEADQLGPARATVEVYRFFYGYYRRGVKPLEPGDPVEVAVRLPDPNLLPIFDLDKLAETAAAGSRGGRTGEVAPPVPGGRDDARGTVRLDPVYQEGPRQTQPGSTPASGGAQPPAKAELPPNAQPGPESLTAAAGMFLLDVARSPVAEQSGLSGQSRQPFVVLLAAPGGQILTRTPDENRTELYRRVERSAREGETQGQPAAPEVQTQPPRGQQPMPGRPMPQPEDEGGGGGG